MGLNLQLGADGLRNLETADTCLAAQTPDRRLTVI